MRNGDKTVKYKAKIKLDLHKIFRKIKSQRRGWVFITSEDRDWDFGKPLKTKDLQEIVKNMRKNAFLC